MSNPYIRFAGREIPQTEQANPAQTKNNAGGYVYTLSVEDRLRRFLIIGSAGGTYYQSENEITKQNVDFIINKIKADPYSVISVVFEISSERRALRQSPAIFVTALILQHIKDYQGPNKNSAYAAAKDLAQVVCKTSTQLFELCRYIELLGGWNRTKRSVVQDWYQNKSNDDLAYQVVKYRQRNGWSHRDAMRLGHTNGLSPAIASFVGAKYSEGSSVTTEAPGIIQAFEIVQGLDITKPQAFVTFLNSELGKNLPWEALPTQVLKFPEIWKTLFYNGQLRNQALIRNITRLARVEAFKDLKFAGDYAEKLVAEASGLHPLNFLNAYLVHTNGQVVRENDYRRGLYVGSRRKDWVSSEVIVDALNVGFYEAFKKLKPTGKRYMLAIDVSGSMSANASGLDMSCAQLCAAMAMSIARSERNYMIRGFTANRTSYPYRNSSQPMEGFIDLGISASTDLNKAFGLVHRMNFGATDCALPMLWAAKNNVEIDTFVVLTDSETWQGNVHADTALERYRQKTGINAGLAVVAATATPFTIGNPNDPKTLNVVGADANLPRLIQEFA